MIACKKQFFGGTALMAGFFIVLFIFFSPVFNGQNGLNYLDGLYNSISKGSAYYIPDLIEQVKEYEGVEIDVELHLESDAYSQQIARLFLNSNVMVGLFDNTVKMSGDLSRVLLNCLEDTDLMYSNNGKTLEEKYNYDPKRMMFNWWTILKYMEKDLEKQKRFKEAKIAAVVKKKAVETSYNYFGIEPQNIMDRLGIVIFSLVFYVVYTLWYGFAILFIFEGWGLKLEH